MQPFANWGKDPMVFIIIFSEVKKVTNIMKVIFGRMNRNGERRCGSERRERDKILNVVYTLI